MRSRRFHALLGLALTSTLAACSSSLDRDGFATDPVCEPGLGKVEILRVELGVDWLRVGSKEAGTPCASAKDKTACAQKIEEVKGGAEYGFGLGDGYGFAFVMSKGDEVKRLADLAEVRRTFGAVDTPAKAYYLFMANGYSPDCDAFIKKTSAGYELIGTIETSSCDPLVTEEHRVQIAKDGAMTILEKVEKSSASGVCSGRRPEGMENEARARVNALADWFSRAAELEAASVHAFDILREELAHHGAPARLLRACERAKKDEIRHTAMMTRLAKRFGGAVKEQRVQRRPLRSLRAMALENAIEGCVRETYGALEAAVSAARATDRVVARTMRVIARDEARHAELSWQILAWSRSRLDRADRRAIEEAIASESASLEVELTRGIDPMLERIAGLPSPSQAKAALEALRDRFWRTAA